MAAVLSNRDLMALVSQFQDGVYASISRAASHLNTVPFSPSILCRTKIAVSVATLCQLGQDVAPVLDEPTKLLACQPHLHLLVAAYACCVGHAPTLAAYVAHAHPSAKLRGRLLDLAAACNHMSLVHLLLQAPCSPSDGLVLAADYGHRALLPELLPVCMSSVPTALEAAAAAGHLAIVGFLHTHSRLDLRASRALDKAAMHGHLEVVRYLHADGYSATSAAMDLAATHGHLHILSYLHAVRTERWSRKALDGAAANGHLGVVQFLHAHQQHDDDDLCSPTALRGASANGHLEMVRYLYASASPAAIADAIDYAAANGHREIVSFFLARDGATFSAAAITEAARNGHGAILSMLLECAPSLVSEAALVAAAAKGHVHVVHVLWAAAPQLPVDKAYVAAVTAGHAVLHALFAPLVSSSTLAIALERAATNGHLALVETLLAVVARSSLSVKALDAAAAGGHGAVVAALHAAGAPCSTQALDSAARQGHLEVAAFLIQHRTEGATIEAWDGAARRGHLEVLQLLHRHVFVRGGSFNALPDAARLGQAKVVRYLIEHDAAHCALVADALAAATAHEHEAVAAYLRQVSVSRSILHIDESSIRH
ncbi:hypothetical protein SPRG_12615 [Saprolegnia parasitica CBS 223.65]|uniref:Uncharacterized protein n=1 Tax=Saprolegnia parasitica (strain CBS 223.65) TaxID=695850 RepID=A0A067C4R9_SAPPC|nr:hypothetical protein SPRG_12615 [Saprolegnia parasitica CBS 223.65]KDO21797.1 hypothetical protein SPRG_12615 [Saprolegnia parasitica CBS 223.65]|eukprot:XP_012207475.1 hypothetical protein SPRG_12615 [Saprolegnia parasitica CBS 223.65]